MKFRSSANRQKLAEKAASNRVSRYVLAIFVSGSLVSCVTPSPPGETSQITVSEAQASIPAGDQPVRWGGTIVEVSNTATGTIVQIVSRPLRGSGRPVRNDRTDGRFLAEVAGFLDPEIVKKGRDITVTGTLNGTREGAVGDTSYQFPVVAVDQYRYWKPVVAHTAQPHHFPHAYPYRSWRDEFWHDWPHAPHRSHHHHHHRGSIVRGGVTF